MGCAFVHGEKVSSNTHLRFLFFLKARVLAVLDWELSTTGHPLADLAYAAQFYFWPASIKGSGQGSILGFKGTIGMKQ